MPTDFKFYGILCCTPPDLESERLVFESSVTQFVEQVSMPDQVLFAPASLRPPINAAVQKAAIDSNIRTCEFSIHIFGEQWPDPVFAGFVDYAVECAADPTKVTRQACVLFRNFHAAVPELRHLRERLAAARRCELRDFTARKISPINSVSYSPPGTPPSNPEPPVERPFRLLAVASSFVACRYVGQLVKLRPIVNRPTY